MTLSEQIREYNGWRRGCEDVDRPDPRALGLMLDAAADRMEYLETINTAAEQCYRMMLNEPYTGTLMIQAEQKLRIALSNKRKTRKK